MTDSEKEQGGIEELSRLVVGLQEKISFQEDVLQQLNEVISKQDIKIVELQAQLKVVYGIVNKPRDNLEVANEPPPHY